jgi:hypothetical protein
VPKSNVTLNVTLELQHSDAASLDRQISGAVAEVGQQLWTAVLEQLKAVVEADRANCTACGGALKSNGRRPRVHHTSVGKVKFERQRLRCINCGQESVPLDQALGLAARSTHSLEVQERCLLLATEMSYAKASRTAGEMRGWEVSHGLIHDWAQEVGAELEQEVAEVQASMFEHGVLQEVKAAPDTLWVSVDGTLVHDRDRQNMEIKAGMVWSKVATISKGRTQVVDRTLYAGVESSAVFAERLVTQLQARGVFHARQVFLVADGADWIKTFGERYLPHAVYLLDWYHLVENLRYGLGHQHPRLGRALELARAGRAYDLIQLLERAARRLEDPDQIPRCRKLIDYVHSNRDGIKNYRLVPLASSGPMEKAIDILASRRLKSRGMSWRRPGAHHMVRLRLLRLNNRWDEFWNQRRQAQRREWPLAA